MLKSILKKIIPTWIISWYHKILAYLAMIIYLNPSSKLIIIGVTGTNGKSTVVNLIGEILNKAGHKTGWTSTTNFSIGDKSWLNDKKMTMLGRFQTRSGSFPPSTGVCTPPTDNEYFFLSVFETMIMFVER